MVTYVSLFSVLEVLLNRPDVFEKVVFNEDCLPGQYRSFQDGQFYKLNTLLGGQGNCISLGVYVDDFEVCYPLGTSRKIHKITAVYWVVLNLPAKFCSTLPSIQHALFGKSGDGKKFGFEKFFDPLLKDLGCIEQQGIFVKAINSHLKGTVFCVCGDKLAAHGLAGFQESFQVENLCRFCLANKKDIQTKTRPF